MLAMLIGADGFLCDIQFYRELELRKVFFLKKLTNSVLGYKKSPSRINAENKIQVIM